MIVGHDGESVIDHCRGRRALTGVQFRQRQAGPQPHSEHHRFGVDVLGGQRLAARNR